MDLLNMQRFRDILSEAFNEKEEELWTCDIEDNQKSLWDNLLRATDQICGWYKVSTRSRVTWCWNNLVDRAIRTKNQAWKDWKDWKDSSSNKLYQSARRKAKWQVYLAKGEEKKKFAIDLQHENQPFEDGVPGKIVIMLERSVFTWMFTWS